MSHEKKGKKRESKYRDQSGSFRSSIPRWADMANINDGYGGYEYMDPWGQIGLKYAPQYYSNEPVRRYNRSNDDSSSSGDTASTVQNEPLGKETTRGLQGRKIALILVVVGLVAIAVAIIPVLVLTLKPAESQPNKFRVVTMSLAVDEPFKPEYNNKLSLEYKSFAANFTNAMDEIFKANNTMAYKGNQIKELRNGSVIVIFTVVIEFKQSEKPHGEEVFKAVITGQKTYERDNNSVVVKTFRILKTSVSVVTIDDVLANPISPTTETTTTSTTVKKPTTTTSITSSPNPELNNYSVATMNLTLDEPFRPEYYNNNSLEYKSFVENFTNAMDKIFKANNTVGYKGSQIKELKNGSVIVILIIVIEVKQNEIPPGEEVLKAVITGQQKDAMDNTTVLIERFKIFSTSVGVVAIDKVSVNPISPTTESTTTKTSTSATTFQPSTSPTVKASTTSPSNSQPNTTSTKTSTITTISTPTTTSVTLQPTTSTTSTSTTTTKPTTTSTSPVTSEPNMISTTTSTSATTTQASTIKTQQPNTTTSTTSTSTTTTTPTTTSTSPETSEQNRISITASTSTTASMPTTTPVPNMTTMTSSTSVTTPMPTRVSTTSLKTPEENTTITTTSTSTTITQASTITTQQPNTTTSTTSTSTTTTTPTTTSTSPGTSEQNRISITASTSTTASMPTTTPEPNMTTMTSSTSVTTPMPTRFSTTSLKTPEENTTITTTLTSTTITQASTITTQQPNTTTSTTSTSTTTTKPTTTSTSPGTSEQNRISITTLTSTTTSVPTVITIASPNTLEPNMTTTRSSTSSTASKATTTITTTHKSPEPSTNSTTTSTSATSVKPTTNNTTSSNTPSTYMTTPTASTSTTAANVITTIISSSKSPEPSTISTTTSTSTTSLKPATNSTTSSNTATPNMTTPSASTSINAANVTTTIISSSKILESNTTRTTTQTSTTSVKPTTNSTTSSNTPALNMTITTASTSTTAANVTTTSISSPKPTEPSTTSTTTPTSTTSFKPSTISTTSPKSLEPNTTTATTSTSTTTSNLTTYSSTPLKPTETNMTSTTVSTSTTTLYSITTSTSSPKATELSTTIATISTSTATLRPNTTSTNSSTTPEPNATNTTTSTSTSTTKPISTVSTTMTTTNMSTAITMSTNSTMTPSTTSSTTIASTTTTPTGVAFNMKNYTAVVGAPLQLTCVVTGWNGNLSISRVSRSNQQQVKVVNLVNNETGSILNGFATNRTFSGYNVNVSIFILNVSCEDEGLYYCTSGAVSDNATVKRLPEKPTILLPDIIIRGTYHDVKNPFVCEGEVENPGGILIAEVNMNGTFYLYKAFGETRSTITSECGAKQLYKFFVDGTFTQDWDNAKIRCVAINNITGAESGIRQTSQEKTIRLLPADICKDVTTGSNISHPHSNCDLYLTCQAADKLLLGICPHGMCFFDNVRTCRSLECPFVYCNDTEVAIGKGASIACDIFFCGASFSLAMNHSGERFFSEINISSPIVRNLGNLSIHIFIRNGSALLNLTFLETKCNDSGEYIIDLNRGNFTDRAYLTLNAPNKIPILTLPQSIVGCAEGTISCTGELGVPQENIYLEVKFRGGNYTKYDQTSLHIDKKECSNTGNLEMKFIAGDKWNGAQVRCITGNKTETKMESYVQQINITNSGVCFSPDEYLHYLNGTAQLNCTVTGLTSGDIVTFSRVKSGNDTVKSFATVEFSKEPTYNISGIHIRAVPLLANDFIFILTIISVSCGDRGTYFCKVGNRQASARLIIWQKPGTPTLIMSRLIFENTYMQPEYPLVCQGEVGYPSGKMMVEVNKNGSYAKYDYFQISSVLRVSDDECSTYETLKFSIPGLVSMNMNNTLMRCVATNNITITPNESPPTSLLQRIYVVPDSFCSSLNNGNYRHPYECTMYISCMNRLIKPETCVNQCANATGIGSITCVNCSTLRCKDQEGFIEPTTAATTTTIAACPYVRCESVHARLNNSATIYCQILFCGETFNLSVMSVGINIKNRVNNTFSATKNNVRVLVNADKGAATLNITFDPVECDSAGTYNISIDNGEAYDLPNLEVKVNPETPTFTIPSDMYENQRTTATCTAQLGDPPGSLYLELMPVGGQYARLGESFSVNISKGNCSNNARLDAVFYPNATWNGSKFSCVAEGPDKLQTFRSDEKVTVIKSPKIYFTKTSYSEFVGSFTRLTCVAKEMSSADLQTVKIERYFSSGGYEFVASVFINGTVKNAFQNVSISNESSINSSSATIHIDFHYLSCAEKGNYYCTAGGFSAKGSVNILRKPGIPTFNMSKYIYENKYMQIEHPMVCEGEVGYPSGKMVVEAYTNGSFREYQYYNVSRAVRVSEDTCSTHEMLQFSVPGLVPLTLNNTAMRCVATNDIALTSHESPPTSQQKRLYVVPVSFCNGLKTGDYRHPYECTFYITCTAGVLYPGNCFGRCANITSGGAQCLDCSQVNCMNPGLIEDTTTAITTTTKITCPTVQCDDTYASLNESESIKCRIKFCGPTFEFSIMSDNLKLQNSVSGNFSRTEGNVQVNDDADSGNADLSIIFDSIKCINAGTYNVSIDSGVAFDIATLHVKVIHEIPTLTIPHDIYENQKTAIYCTAQLGDPPGSLHIEISSPGKPPTRFESLVSITRGNCSNIGRVDVEFYPNSALNGSNIVCMANGPNNQGPSLLEEKTILIKSPKIYFTNTSNSGFIGSSTRLTCLIKEMSSTDLQTVRITRDSTPGGTEFVASFSMNRTIHSAFQNISISSESSINSSVATIHVDFYQLTCTDERNYYCNAGTFFAKGTLQILRKPRILDFKFPVGIVENANAGTFNCTAEKGYPAGRLVIETNRNGSFVEAPFMLNRNNATNDGCSNIEIVTFSHTFTSTWNRTAIQCKAENEFILGKNEAPPSVAKNVLVVPADICQTSNTLFIPHPYECHKFMQCGTSLYIYDCPGGLCRYTVPHNASYCEHTCNNCTDFGM